MQGIAGPIGGADTQVIYNSAGSAAGNSNLTWNNTSSTLISSKLDSQSYYSSGSVLTVQPAYLLTNLVTQGYTGTSFSTPAILAANTPVFQRQLSYTSGTYITGLVIGQMYEYTYSINYAFYVSNQGSALSFYDNSNVVYVINDAIDGAGDARMLSGQFFFQAATTQISLPRLGSSPAGNFALLNTSQIKLVRIG
jgi:hypothetical protein